MTVEELARRFVILVSKTTLSRAEQEEARQLMRQLREAGMSNEEISKLSKGKWTPSTVKYYTPGIKPPHPSQWGDSVALLDRLISSRLTFDDVETAVTVSDDLESHNVNLTSVIDLLLAAESSSLQVAELIHLFELFRESGLSPKNVSETLSFKEELKKRGLELDSLESLVKLAQKHGAADKIIQAVSEHASLEKLSEQIDAANGELERLNQQQDKKRKQVEEIEVKLTNLKEPMEAYAKAVDLGFAEHELVKLSGLAQKYGGVREVLKAVEAYASFSDIMNKKTKARVELGEARANTNQLEAQSAHLRTAITMCRNLIETHNYGLDAVAMILSVANKYGQPMEVLRALDSFGRLQTLEKKLRLIEGQIAEREKSLAEMEGRYQESLDRIESLNATALRIGSQVGEIEGRLESSRDLQRLLKLLQAPSEADYASNITLVIFMVAVLRAWVNAHRSEFTNVFLITNSLTSLQQSLGGG